MTSMRSSVLWIFIQHYRTIENKGGNPSIISQNRLTHVELSIVDEPSA